MKPGASFVRVKRPVVSQLSSNRQKPLGQRKKPGAEKHEKKGEGGTALLVKVNRSAQQAITGRTQAESVLKEGAISMIPRGVEKWGGVIRQESSTVKNQARCAL